MFVFISYNSKDRQLAETLAEDIDGFGHAVWFDQELTGGHAWWNSIVDNIRQCDVFIFALTPQALDSYPCKLEYTYAHNLGKYVLPVLMTDVNTDLLPEALSTIQFVDYRQPNKRASIALGRALSALPPARLLPDPLPPAPAVPISSLGKLKERIENEAALTLEEQASLVLEIKDFLQQPNAADSARDLLARFKNRSDLFAKIDREISSILSGTQDRSRPRRPAPAAQPATAPRRFILAGRGLANLRWWSRIRSMLWPYLSAVTGAFIFLAPFYADAYNPFITHLLAAFLVRGAFRLARTVPGRLHRSFPTQLPLITIVTYVVLTVFVWGVVPYASRDSFYLVGTGIIGGGFMLSSLPFVGRLLSRKLIAGALGAIGCYPVMWWLIGDYWRLNEAYLAYLGVIVFAAATSLLVYLPEFRILPKADAPAPSIAAES